MIVINCDQTASFETPKFFLWLQVLKLKLEKKLRQLKTLFKISKHNQIWFKVYLNLCIEYKDKMLSGWRWCIWGHDLEVEVKVETRPPWWELISASWPLSRTREGWGYLLPSRVPSRSWINTVNRNENKQINCFIPLTPRSV